MLFELDAAGIDRTDDEEGNGGIEGGFGGERISSAASMSAQSESVSVGSAQATEALTCSFTGKRLYAKGCNGFVQPREPCI